MNIRKVISPDGALCLVVIIDANDTTIGFDGYPWHTHGNILFSTYALEALRGLSDEDAINNFAAKVTNGELMIAVVSKDGNTLNVVVSDDPVDLKNRLLRSEETVRFRLWNGESVSV